MTITPPAEPELDLDYGLLGVDDEDEVLIEAPRYVRTEVAPYASPLGQMDAMWDTLRAFRESKHRKIEAGGGIVERGLPAPPAPRGPKALAARLEGAGFAVRSVAIGVRLADLLFMGSTDEHDAGDVRTPGHVRYRWDVQAVLCRKGVTIAWCWATWERREVGPKPGNKFVDAATWDIVSLRDPEGPGTGRGYEVMAGDFDDWVSVFAPKGS